MLIKITELPHPKYQRKGNNLVYVHKIELVDCLCAAPFEIETLDHRAITVPLDEIVTPHTKKVISSEGMPICEDNLLKPKNEKGDLFIFFDVIFPAYVEEGNKQILKELLT